MKNHGFSQSELKAGVEVIETTPEMVEGVVGEEVQSHKKLSAPETASVQEEHQPTVVSSTDGAKVLKEIDPAIEGYENKGNRAITIKKRINGVSVVATIEKCALINNLNGLSNTVAENQNTSLWGKDTKLISLLQTNSSRVANKNRENKKPAACGCRFFIEEYLIQKVLDEFFSLKSFLYTILSIATTKNIRQIAHSAKCCLSL